ncbi:MAG TPA: adenylate/guanylate cyclase domain-containing protein [bacterium]|nr:adenylate/guanylate cyclase domain-containing protein [bacterium]
MAGSNGAKRSRASGRSYVRLGEVLVQEGVITKRQLKKALEQQKALRKSLGETVVALGMATEEQIIGAFNRRYQANLTSLGADLDNYLRTRGIKAERGRFSVRIPIKVKLSITVIFIIWTTILGLSYVVFDRQRVQLEAQTVKTGKVLLGYVANNAVVPLSTDDLLQLNTLLKESSNVEGVKYAIIVGRDGIVRAHTDPAMIRKPYQKVAHRQAETQEGPYHYFSYVTNQYGRSLDLGKIFNALRSGDFRLEKLGLMDQFGLAVKDLLKVTGVLRKGTRMLDMSEPVQYSGKVLGTVHVGISQDFIVEQIIKGSVFIVLLSVLLIVLGVVIAIFLAGGFSRPLAELVTATEEIGLGNLKYRIKKIRNDELGDLASAFNFMSGELLKKALMQESFGKYVGSEVLDLIMANPENAWLKGTRSHVSVLFTDVRGFTSYSEQREAEQVVEALNQYFDIATRHIVEHGGYVDKFIGDAVMGVFGIPVASEDHAEQAVRAALAMQAEFARQAAETGNELLARVGIGINTGYAVSGNIGSQEKLEYTVIGDAVNVASRLNGLAAAGETIISASVREALGRALTVEARAPQKVKGKAEPIPVYKVVSITGRAPAPKETPHAQPETG